MEEGGAEEEAWDWEGVPRVKKLEGRILGEWSRGGCHEAERAPCPLRLTSV